MLYRICTYKPEMIIYYLNVVNAEQTLSTRSVNTYSTINYHKHKNCYVF